MVQHGAAARRAVTLAATTRLQLQRCGLPLRVGRRPGDDRRLASKGGRGLQQDDRGGGGGAQTRRTVGVGAKGDTAVSACRLRLPHRARPARAGWLRSLASARRGGRGTHSWSFAEAAAGLTAARRTDALTRTGAATATRLDMDAARADMVIGGAERGRRCLKRAKKSRRATASKKLMCRQAEPTRAATWRVAGLPDAAPRSWPAARPRGAQPRARFR